MKIVPSAKKFWNDHKGQIAVASIVITVATLALALRAGKDIREFVAEHNLTDEYFSPEA